jgi:hypothetical protein
MREPLMTHRHHKHPPASGVREGDGSEFLPLRGEWDHQNGKWSIKKERVLTGSRRRTSGWRDGQLFVPKLTCRGGSWWRGSPQTAIKAPTSTIWTSGRVSITPYPPLPTKRNTDHQVHEHCGIWKNRQDRTYRHDSHAPKPPSQVGSIGWLVGRVLYTHSLGQPLLIQGRHAGSP